MEFKKLTSLFIVGVIIAIGIYDVYAIVSGGTEATISYRIRVWSHEYPAFTFLIGFCMGHLFWPMKKTPNEKKLALRVEELEAQLKGETR